MGPISQPSAKQRAVQIPEARNGSREEAEARVSGSGVVVRTVRPPAVVPMAARMEEIRLYRRWEVRRVKKSFQVRAGGFDCGFDARRRLEVEKEAEGTRGIRVEKPRERHREGVKKELGMDAGDGGLLCCRSVEVYVIENGRTGVTLLLVNFLPVEISLAWEMGA